MDVKTEIHTFNIRISDDVKGWIWYANMQGRVFKARNCNKDCFMLVGERLLVWKTDCEIVK